MFSRNVCKLKYDTGLLNQWSMSIKKRVKHLTFTVNHFSNQRRRACPKSMNGPLDPPPPPAPLYNEFPFAGDVELLGRSLSVFISIFECPVFIWLLNFRFYIDLKCFKC